MEKLLNSVQKYVMLVVVVLSGTVYGADFGIRYVRLSENAKSALRSIDIDKIFDNSFSRPRTREKLISFCDNMTDAQVNAVFDSAVSEMQALYARMTAGGDSARRACEDVVHHRPAAGPQGNLLFSFLGRDKHILSGIGDIAGLQRFKNDSPFSVNTTEDKKLFIALCVAVLNRVLDDWNRHNQDMRESRDADGMYSADAVGGRHTEQEHDDYFYNDTLVETFSEPDSSGNAYYGLTSAVREVIENIH